MLANITSPYTSFEAFFYDALVAPAVATMAENIALELIATLPKRARVLEVGSGGGQLAMHLASKRSDISIKGVDFFWVCTPRNRQCCHCKALPR